jgi:hypothetical protein
MLFPCKRLPQHVKNEIILNWPDQDLAGNIDKLFLCPDHFGPSTNAKLPIKLRSDCIFSFSADYIFELLADGRATFRHGVKGMKKLHLASHLVSNVRHQPSFVDPKPASSLTLESIRRLFTMEGPSNEGLEGMMDFLEQPMRSPSFSSFPNR